MMAELEKDAGAYPLRDPLSWVSWVTFFQAHHLICISGIIQNKDASFPMFLSNPCPLNWPLPRHLQGTRAWQTVVVQILHTYSCLICRRCLKNRRYWGISYIKCIYFKGAFWCILINVYTNVITTTSQIRNISIILPKSFVIFCNRYYPPQILRQHRLTFQPLYTSLVCSRISYHGIYRAMSGSSHSARCFCNPSALHISVVRSI